MRLTSWIINLWIDGFRLPKVVTFSTYAVDCSVDLWDHRSYTLHCKPLLTKAQQTQYKEQSLSLCEESFLTSFCFQENITII